MEVEVEVGKAEVGTVEVEKVEVRKVEAGRFGEFVVEVGKVWKAWKV